MAGATFGRGRPRDVLAFIDGALIDPGGPSRFVETVGRTMLLGIQGVNGHMHRLYWERDVAEARVDALKAEIRVMELGGDLRRPVEGEGSR